MRRDRSADEAHRRPEVKRDLFRGMWVARVGHDDVDRAGDRVAPHRDGEEAGAETRRQAVDQLRERDHLPQVRRLGAREVAP